MYRGGYYGGVISAAWKYAKTGDGRFVKDLYHFENRSKRDRFRAYLAYLVIKAHGLPMTSRIYAEGKKPIFDFDFHGNCGNYDGLIYASYGDRYNSVRFSCTPRELLDMVAPDKVEIAPIHGDFKQIEIHKCNDCGQGYRETNQFDNSSFCRVCVKVKGFFEAGFILGGNKHIDKYDKKKDDFTASCKYCRKPAKIGICWANKGLAKYVCECQKPRLKPVKTIEKGIKKLHVSAPSEKKRIAKVTYSSSIAERGFVYAVRHEWIKGRVKIGATTKTPEERANALQRGMGLPSPLEVIASMPVDNAKQAENDAHCHFEAYHEGGEWFELTTEQVKEYFAG